jgi:hypothetical protein
VTVVRAFLDFRDFSTAAGELDMVAELEVSHSSNAFSIFVTASSSKPYNS